MGQPLRSSAAKTAPDLLFHESVALWPVAVLMFIMGVASPFWIRAIDPTVTALVDSIQTHLSQAIDSSPGRQPTPSRHQSGTLAEKQ